MISEATAQRIAASLERLEARLRDLGQAPEDRYGILNPLTGRLCPVCLKDNHHGMPCPELVKAP